MNYNNAIEKTILFIESHLTASFTVEDAAKGGGIFLLPFKPAVLRRPR